ncbi:MAG: tRNA uridine-5-carboxymethylaminomethyl(34) synthesis GTPase MnmE [Bacteroidota bacterium]
MFSNDTICAISSPTGSGAISLIRASGKGVFSILSKNVKLSSKVSFEKIQSRYVYNASIFDDQVLIDEVLIWFFRAPHSYTGEDMAEISCHGSPFIQQKIIQLLVQAGARIAKPGEFTQRAFLNHKLDLSQAEAVNDIIRSHSETAHKLAMNQMRGGYSEKIRELRSQLLHFSSLIELELDFSEEDLSFADSGQLLQLLMQIQTELDVLIDSFQKGNALKNGIPVAIVGKPNVGKSTLLNALLNDERAIVSEIPGTTRDAVEDTVVYGGYLFRFIDTAGLRNTQESIEQKGIQKTHEKIRQSAVIIYVVDISLSTIEEIVESLQKFQSQFENEISKIIVVANKTDLLESAPHGLQDLIGLETVFISAKRKVNISLLIESLVTSVKENSISDTPIVTSLRHYDAFISTQKNIQALIDGVQKKISRDLLTPDLRNALHSLGEVCGEITTDEVLNEIFGKFCIGK